MFHLNNFNDNPIQYIMYCGYTCPVNVSSRLTLVTHVHFNEVFGCTNRVYYDQNYVYQQSGTITD